jgi:hypothetical protein
MVMNKPLSWQLFMAMPCQCAACMQPGRLHNILLVDKKIPASVGTPHSLPCLSTVYKMPHIQCGYCGWCML